MTRSKREIAEAFGVSTQAIDQWLMRGCPKPQRAGRETLYDLGQVLRWRLITGRRHRQALDEDLVWLGRELASLELVWLLLWMIAPESLPEGVEPDLATFDDGEIEALVAACRAQPQAIEPLRALVLRLADYFGADKPFTDAIQAARSLNRPG